MIKKTILCTAAIFTLETNAIAQNAISSALKSVENNNTTLKALRDGFEAQKLENRTGNTLENPEFEFNYLWGNPSNLGRRRDFSLKQTFDFATVLGMKNNFADKRNALLDLQYNAERINILLQAKQICIELVYYNARQAEMQTRLQHAQTLAGAYSRRFNAGDVSVLEYNKSQLNLSMLKNEISRIEIERQNRLATLAQLNGGAQIAFTETHYADKILPPDFETWYTAAEAKNPMLTYVKNNVEVMKSQVKLRKAEGLPKISAGYMSELLPNDKFRGISLGVSVPLWENKNRVRQAKAAVRAAESSREDAKTQFYLQLKNLYAKAVALQANALEYRQTLEKTGNAVLLKKALDAGEISLLDYIIEIGFYYQTIDNALAAERDFELSLAELEAVEL